MSHDEATRNRSISSRVRIDPPNCGLDSVSFAMCERIRSVSRERLANRKGDVSNEVMRRVEDGLRLLLAL